MVRQESTYYPDFSIKSFNEYVNDKLTLCEVYSEPDDDNNIHSKLYKWHENGQLLGEESYVNGIIHGPAYMYYPDGQVEFKCIYKNGHKFKVWVWYESGQLCIECTHKDGKPDGLYRRWHTNGQLWIEGTYKDGQLNGLYRTWNSDGVLISDKVW